MRTMRYALPLVFSLNACKALAKLQLSWGNGGSYQLRRNRDRGDRYLNSPTGPMSAVRQLSARGHGFFNKGDQMARSGQTPTDAQAHIEH
jgi:hypothetical protein